METCAIHMLQIWCQSSDLQSCISFLSDLVTKQIHSPVDHLCLTRLKKYISLRVEKQWGKPEDWNHLLELILSGNTHDLVVFQMVAFVVKVLAGNMQAQVLDFQHLNEKMLERLKEAEELTKDILKVSKYCYQIWRYAAQSKSLQSSLLIAAFRLQTILQVTSLPQLRGLFAVLLVLLLRATGEAYQMKTVCEYVRVASEEVLKTKVYPELFLLQNWEKLDNGSLSPFSHSSIPQFQSISLLVHLPKLDLSTEIQSIFAVRSLNRADLQHLNPAHITLLESFQSSAIHTSDFSPSRNRDGDATACTADVQVDLGHAARGSAAEWYEKL